MTKAEVLAKLMERFEEYAEEAEDGDRDYWKTFGTADEFVEDFAIYIQASLRLLPGEGE